MADDSVVLGRGQQEWNEKRIKLQEDKSRSVMSDEGGMRWQQPYSESRLAIATPM
jgi:hypothetical protein